MSRIARSFAAQACPWLVGTVVVAQLVGCANLDAVRKFAETSAATADYKQVVADYAESPKRSMRYVSEAGQLDILQTNKGDTAA